LDQYLFVREWVLLIDKIKGREMMDLCLSVVSYHRYTSGVEETKQLKADSGESVITIGRASQCSWCLLDPERVISSRHARVESVKGQYWLYDTSTNGVFVNRSVEPLNKDQPYLLNDGDVLVIGDYEIAVVISDAKQSPQSHLEASKHPGVVVDSSVSSPLEPAASVAEDFGMLAEPNSASNSSLDSTFNANLDDALSFPPELGGDEQSNIPEDWNALFAGSNLLKSEPAVVAAASETLNPPTKTNSVAHQQSSVPPAVAASAPVSSPSISKATSLQASEQAATQLAAFLEGMGISSDLISQDNAVRWWHQLGVITRDSLDGIMNTLHNRAAFKESSRINQTTFRRNENNPLKFSTNAEDAIHNLLQRKTAGFLPPERAVKEAFIDLERHEYALLSGIEGAVAGLMQLLDPKSIESKELNKRGIAKVYSAIEKHKNWNRYCSIYSDLENEFNRNSNAFYMEDFAKAYESTLKSIEQKGQR